MLLLGKSWPYLFVESSAVSLKLQHNVSIFITTPITITRNRLIQNAKAKLNRLTRNVPVKHVPTNHDIIKTPTPQPPSRNPCKS